MKDIENNLYYELSIIETAIARSEIIREGLQNDLHKNCLAREKISKKERLKLKTEYELFERIDNLKIIIEAAERCVIDNYLLYEELQEWRSKHRKDHWLKLRKSYGKMFNDSLCPDS